MNKLTNSYRPLKKILMATTMIVSMSMISSTATAAGVGKNELPTGEKVVDGIVSFDKPVSNQLDITQGSDRAVVSWESFNIGKKATVNVHQKASDILVNTTTNFGKVSKILGSLNADGTVMVLNPNGVLFSKNSKIDVGSIVASTGTLDRATFMAGGNVVLTGMEGTGKIINKSKNFTVKDGGFAAFVAPSVVNKGTIVAKMGTVTLAAADSATITIDTYGDGLVELDTGISAGKGVKNTGKISAKYVELTTAQLSNVVGNLINLDGIVEAYGASVDDAGVITLKTDVNGGVSIADGASIDADTLNMHANTVLGSGVTSTIKNIDVKNATSSLRTAYALVNKGGRIKLANGIYDLGTTSFNYDKDGVTLSGTSKNRTILDGSNINGYGVNLTADDATLARLTLIGGNDYGIKATGNNLTLKNLVAKGAAKTEIDLNGVEKARLTNVKADGLNTDGVGISMANSSDIILRNIKTANNNWGGIGVYQNTHGLTITGNRNSFGEANKLYTEVDGYVAGGPNPWTISGLKLNGFTHSVVNTGHRGDGGEFVYYQQSEADALNFALDLSAADTGYVQTVGADSKGYTFRENNFIVDQNATDSLSVQTAIANADAYGVINVKEGTYDLGTSTLYYNTEGLTLQGSSESKTILDGSKIGGYTIDLTANEATIANLTLLGGDHYGVKATGDNLTLTNFTIDGSYRTGVDMNGVNNAWLTNVTSKNADYGVGISMTNASNINMTNITTANNAWGGVAIYHDVDGVTLTGTNSFGEANKLYTEIETGIPDTITDLKLDGFSHSVVNTGHRSGGENFTFYQQSEADALNFALDMSAANTGYIQTVGTENGYTVLENNFIVGQNATDSLSVQVAVANADAGGVINVKEGIYDLGTSTLYYNTEGLTLQGSSESKTILDGSKIGGYTIDLTANEATIANLTLLGGDHYGVKAEGDNLTLTNFTIDGSYRTGVDMNGVNNAWLTNVTSKNADYGVGISMTNASNINMTNITTANNAWGGVAIYHDVDGVTLTGTNSLGEANKLYTEIETNKPDTITDLKLDGFSHSVVNTGHRSNGENFTFYQQSEADALNFALGLSAANTGYIQTVGADASGFTIRENNFIVGQDATNTLSIQTAIDNAEDGGVITVKEGEYDGSLYMYKSLTINGANAGVAGNSNVRTAETVINADAWYGIYIDADNSIIDGIKVVGNSDNSTTSAVRVSNANGVTIKNNIVTNSDFGVKLANSNSSLTDGSLVTDNLIYDINAHAVYAGYNHYTDVTNNTIYDTAVGVTIEGMRTDIDNTTVLDLVVSGNDISASMIGIRSNMYGGGSDYAIKDNTINAEGVDVDRRWTGIDVLSQTGDIATSFTNNVIDGSALDGSGRLVVGYEATNVASENVTIDGGSITGVDYGVWATDGSAYAGAVNDLTVSNVTFNNVREGDFLVEDTIDVSNDAKINVNNTSAHITIGSGNSFSSSAYDLVFKGANSTATVANDANVMSVLVEAAGSATYDAKLHQSASADTRLTIANASIQNAVNATNVGGKVTISNGTYNEYLTLNKKITINGSADTTLQGFGKGNGITLAAGADGVTLSNITVDGYNSGLKVENATSIDGLTITNSAFNNNVHGWYFAKGDNDANNHSTVTNVLVKDTKFEGNTGKGIYAEKLDNAMFKRILVDGSGVDPLFVYHDVGIDINLKNGDYENITFDHLTIANSGANASNGKSGAAIWVKARNDGATYSLTPGSLDNLVITNSNITAAGDVALALGGDIDGITLENNTITGPQAITMYGDLTDVTLAGNRINTRGSSEGVLENIYTSNGHAIGLHTNIEIDAADNTFNGTHVSDMTRAELFNLENNINHGLDVGYDGLVRTADSSIFVTGNDDASPSTNGFRGVRFANTGNLIGMQNVVNSLLPTLLANIAPAAGGDASAPASPNLLQLFSTDGLSNAMRRSNNVVLLNLNDSPVAMVRRTSSGSYELSVDESLLEL